METLSGLREIFLKTLVYVDPDIIQSLVKRWNEECDKIYENTRSLNAEAISKAKSDTAREIFAEIEKNAKTVGWKDPLINGLVVNRIVGGLYLDREDFAELEKKYTKGEQYATDG